MLLNHLEAKIDEYEIPALSVKSLNDQTTDHKTSLTYYQCIQLNYCISTDIQPDYKFTTKTCQRFCYNLTLPQLDINFYARNFKIPVLYQI